jgi:hypothetical protein
VSLRAEIVTGPVLQRVLPRIVGVLAARAELPIDRLSDGLLVADALSAAAQATLGDDVALVLDAHAQHEVTISLGPFPREVAEHLLVRTSLPSAGRIVERLAHVTLEDRSSGTAIVIVLGPDSPRG